VVGYGMNVAGTLRHTEEQQILM